MKFFIFISCITAAILATVIYTHPAKDPPIAEWCKKECYGGYDPYCGCRSNSADSCLDYPNKCTFEIFNCTTQDFKQLIRGFCPSHENFDKHMRCYKQCDYDKEDWKCGCRSNDNSDCDEFVNQCDFEYRNCTTSEYVQVKPGKCQ